MSARAPHPTILAALVLASLLSSGCPDDDGGIPEPDTCTTPSTGPVASLELGQAALDAVFEPWQEGDSVSLVFGGQGGAMLPLRVRVTGAASPCLSIHIAVIDAQGASLVSLDYPMQLYTQGDGSLISETNFAIFDFPPVSGSTVTVQASIGATQVSHSIRLIL